MASAAARVEVAEPVGDGTRIGPEAAGMVAQQALQLGSHVGHAERGVGGDLVEADPEQQLVLGQAPVRRRRPRSWPAAPGSRRSAGRGSGRSYWPKERPGQAADHGPDGHAEHRRAPPARGAGRAWPGRRRPRRREPPVGAATVGALAEGAGQRLEQRAVGVEGVGREGGAVHRHDLQRAPADRGVEAGGLLHVELGHPGQLAAGGSGPRDRRSARSGPRWRCCTRAGGPPPTGSSPGPAACGPDRRGRGCSRTGCRPADRDRSPLLIVGSRGESIPLAVTGDAAAGRSAGAGAREWGA